MHAMICNRSLKSVQTSHSAWRLRCRWSGRWFRAVVYVEVGKSGLAASKLRTSESSAGVVPTFWTPSWDILSFCTLSYWRTWTYIRHIMMLMKHFRCFDVHSLRLYWHISINQRVKHMFRHIHSLSWNGAFHLLLSVIRSLVLRLAHMLGEKLLKQPAVAIRRRLEFIHIYHAVNLMHPFQSLPTWNSRTVLSGKTKHSSACLTRSFYNSTLAFQKEAFNYAPPAPTFFFFAAFSVFFIFSEYLCACEYFWSVIKFSFYGPNSICDFCIKPTIQRCPWLPLSSLWLSFTGSFPLLSPENFARSY